MSLRVEYLDLYYDSLAWLDDSPETNEAVDALITDVQIDPERIPPLDGMLMRELKTEPAAGLRPLRLYFFIEDGALNITHIEPYDEDEL